MNEVKLSTSQQVAQWSILTSVAHVEVVKTKLLKSVVESTGNLLGAVLVVPELGGDEDILALQAGNLSESLLETLADLALVLVDLGQVEVTVAGLEGLVDAGADLAGGRLPGSVADDGDLVARVESDGSSERHGDGVDFGVGDE